MDILNLITFVVGAIIGITSILVAYKIAKKSGVFREVNLKVFLWNLSLLPDPNLTRLFMVIQ